MKEYLENEEIQFNSRKLYESNILYDNVDSPNSRTKEVLSEIKNLWKQNQDKESFIKEISPYHNKNIDLPIFVFDIDLMVKIKKINLYYYRNTLEFQILFLYKFNKNEIPNL